MELSNILEKYWETISEEVNVKEIWILDASKLWKKIVKPIWSAIGKKFGKDTARIIDLAKNWNVKSLDWDNIEVFDWDESWVLAAWDYETSIEWEVSDSLLYQWNVVVSLDLNIDDQLKYEWIAREISRAVNSMRKESNFNVDDKINLLVFVQDTILKNLFVDFGDFVKQEWLVKNFVYNDNSTWLSKLETELWDIFLWVELA